MFFKKIKEYIDKKSKQSKTFKELHSLSDRELNDIGITRYDIKNLIYR